MQEASPISRVILLVLDGLRPDAISEFDLMNLRRLAANGTFTFRGLSVNPPVTAAAMTSLLTGVAPSTHGIADDRFRIPLGSRGLQTLPGVLAEAGLPTSAFMASVPALARGLAREISKRLGVSEARFKGSNAFGIAASASDALRSQKRGLIILHWPDADRAGHEFGWMSAPYELAAIRMDGALSYVVECGRVLSEPGTLLVVLADHGGGGVDYRDHDCPHELNSTIPIIFAGASVQSAHEIHDVSILDVSATIVDALGIPVPDSFEGRAIDSVSRQSQSLAMVI